MFKLEIYKKEIQITDRKLISHFKNIIQNDPELREQFFKIMMSTFEKNGDYDEQFGGWAEGEPEVLIVNIPISLYPTRARVISEV
jgi:hypothetical protein